MLKNRMCKYTVLFCVGGVAYYGIEFAYKRLLSGGTTHWTMALLGGLMFLLIGGINEYFPWEMPLALQACVGGTAITACEFIAGVVLNVWLRLGIWDYSHLPFNLLGQVCLSFFVVWIFISVIAIVLDDWLRWRLFGEEPPQYRWFK